MNLSQSLMLLPGLVVGLTVHEFAHAWSASLLGDNYPRRMGRVSLNPFRHLSLLGTLAIFLLPFGWGKPVMINLYNFRHPRRDYLLSSLAGPAANIAVVGLCLLLAQLTRQSYLFGRPVAMELAHSLLMLIALVNALLAVLNLIPIPPLDGSKIWPCIIPGLKPGMGRKTTWVFLIIFLVLIWTNSLGPLFNFALGNVAALVPRSDMQRVEGLREDAEQALAARQYDRGEQLLTEALAIDPNDEASLWLRATARLGLRKVQAAQADVDLAMQLGGATPDNVKLQKDIMNALGKVPASRPSSRPAKANG